MSLASQRSCLAVAVAIALLTVTVTGCSRGYQHMVPGTDMSLPDSPRDRLAAMLLDRCTGLRSGGTSLTAADSARLRSCSPATRDTTRGQIPDTGIPVTKVP
jgi:hypothetical protein